MECIITYQKSDGTIFIRGSKHDYGKKVGDETSMGWKVLQIHYEFRGNYYNLYDYHKVLKQRQKETIKKRIIDFLIKK